MEDSEGTGQDHTDGTEWFDWQVVGTRVVAVEDAEATSIGKDGEEGRVGRDDAASSSDQKEEASSGDRKSKVM
eukprot:COSAG02_NODE_13754_length_1353_cov_9.479339_1_plen_72_part_10